jgi:hypothetical protein
MGPAGQQVVTEYEIQADGTIVIHELFEGENYEIDHISFSFSPVAVDIPAPGIDPSTASSPPAFNPPAAPLPSDPGIPPLPSFSPSPGPRPDPLTGFSSPPSFDPSTAFSSPPSFDPGTTYNPGTAFSSPPSFDPSTPFSSPPAFDPRLGFPTAFSSPQVPPIRTPAPAPGVSPPPPPVPGSSEEAFQEGRRAGILFGNKIGWAKQVLHQLQEGINGESKGKSSPWSKMSASERSQFLRGVQNALAQLPPPPQYSTKERQAAAEQGFREGLGYGQAQAAAEVFGLWVATQLAIAVATEGALRWPSSPRTARVGPTGVRLGRHLVETEIELQQLAEETYKAIRSGGKEALSKMAENTGFTKEKLADLYDHIFIQQHEIAIGPGMTKTERFAADTEIAELWQQARTQQLAGKDLRRFQELMAHEALERRFMKDGLPYRSSSPEAWSLENVNGTIEWSYNPTPGAYGAHDLAPKGDPISGGPLGHWIQLGVLGK